jgi:hypothetical protein
LATTSPDAVERGSPSGTKEFAAARLSRVPFCDALGRRPPGNPGGCIPLPPEIVKDPDPATYSQALILSSGSWPTFNSPDLETVFLWPVRPIDALTVTVRNLSTDASASGVRVQLSWSPWGIGMPRTPISSGSVDLARAGFAGSEQKVSLATPAEVKAAGRYGIFAELFHPFDRDLNNNAGEQTLDGFRTSQGRAQQFVIPVRNPRSTTQFIDLVAGPPSMASWVTLAPSSFTLAPGAVNNVMAAVVVPAGIPPSPAGTLISATLDVAARVAGQFIGGVSIAIQLDA